MTIIRFFCRCLALICFSFIEFPSNAAQCDIIMSFFTLTLVRHGQTTANKEGILQGQSNTQLSDDGVRQAQLVAQRLHKDHFSHIYSSDLDRAAQTAQIIKEVNKVSECNVLYDKRLRERHFGSLQGRPGKEFRDLLKSKTEDWRPPGGGERSKQVQQRAAGFFDDLCEQMRQLRQQDESNIVVQDARTDDMTSLPLYSTTPEQTVFSMETSPKRNVADDYTNQNRSDDDVPSVDSAIGIGSEASDSFFSLHDSDIRTIRSSASEGDGCPNVSLSPLVEQRYTRFSSVSSGRNSFEDTDFLPPNVHDVLVVSHGGWIRELIRHLIAEYGCRMAGGNRHALLISPNTGTSRFIVTLPDGAGARPRVTSVFLHDRSHLDAEYQTAWDL